MDDREGARGEPGLVDNMGGDDVQTTLGFLEKSVDPHELWREHFPSKVGGIAAWLEPENVPSAEDLRCRVCTFEMVFLLQVYSPLDSNHSAFHRALFVFICRTKDCSGVAALRSQLARKNKYYPEVYDPDSTEHSDALCNLCQLCGLRATKRCAKCSQAWYCSKNCQTFDWRIGHKRYCGSLENGAEEEARIRWRFEESLLVMEDEVTADDSVPEGSALPASKGTLQDAAEDELPEDSFKTADADLLEFQAKVAKDPEQVVRFGREGRVLWPFSQGKLLKSPPVCESCGGIRTLEFQVMPQLLYFLKADNYGIDFGTLAIYTCKNSCDIEGYVFEYVFRQSHGHHG
ncbi:hypothetical protein NDN08_006774 [Rhodosorus marinus]|uniref:MYND-type domain-containing protein n=1 Tax=Rhodosorus marinus TaxID=101924 RepID=A0AAV8UMD1_9RHOD|nr:hypothetical protein NDN08_006774 [Rhodosorus marinus]